MRACRPALSLDQFVSGFTQSQNMCVLFLLFFGGGVSVNYDAYVVLCTFA